MAAALVANTLWWIGFLHAGGIVLTENTWCVFWDVWVQFAAGIMLLLFVLNFRLYTLYHVFKRHRAVSKKPSFWLPLTLTYAIPVITVSVVASVVPQHTEFWDSEHNECWMTPPFKIAIYAVVLCSLLLNGWLTFSLRHIRRSFNEFRELRAGLTMAIMCVVVNCVVVFSTWSFTIPGKLVLSAFNVVSGNFYFWIVLGPPLFGHAFRRKETLMEFMVNLELDGLVESSHFLSTTHTQHPPSQEKRKTKGFRRKFRKNTSNPPSKTSCTSPEELQSQPRTWEEEEQGLAMIQTVSPCAMPFHPSMGSASGPTLKGSPMLDSDAVAENDNIKDKHGKDFTRTANSPDSMENDARTSLPVFPAAIVQRPPIPLMKPPVPAQRAFRQSLGPSHSPKPPTPPKYTARYSPLSTWTASNTHEEPRHRMCSPPLSAVGGKFPSTSLAMIVSDSPATDTNEPVFAAMSYAEQGMLCDPTPPPPLFPMVDPIQRSRTLSPSHPHERVSIQSRSSVQFPHSRSLSPRYDYSQDKACSSDTCMDWSFLHTRAHATRPSPKLSVIQHDSVDISLCWQGRSSPPRGQPLLSASPVCIPSKDEDDHWLHMLHDGYG